ncbi:MAG: restriction endonuclease subunit S [Bacteroidales bacterium]|nr:restriction endonuclease subunit S [Bacteroidales bacterium]
MKKYDTYKNSGVEWLGEIPEHWEIRKIKYLFKEINERSSDGTEDLLSVSQYTGVTKKADKIDEGDLITNAASLEGYKKVFKNDLVSNIMLAWNGSLGFSPFDGITSPAYSVYRLNKNNYERYFHYLLRSQIYKSEFKRNSSGVIESRLRLYTENFYSIWSLLPPLSEQQKIATFLDEKTTKIDQAIAQKEDLIALLKERKQIIIQDLVTGKKVWNQEKQEWTKPTEVKDSGVEWIGEIPKEWEVKRLKYILNEPLKYGANESGIDYSPNLPRYIRITDFSLGGKLNTEKKLSLSWEIGINYLLEDGDILFARSGATVGKSYQFRKSMSIEKHYAFAGYLIKASPNSNLVLSDFLNYYTISGSFESWKNSIFNKATIENIGADKYNELQIPLPPLKIQSKIVHHIETETSKIDRTISLQEQAIERLKELKATLIDSAVTGKMKVNEK